MSMSQKETKIATKHYNLNNNGGYELQELFLNFTTKYKTIKDIHSVFYFKLKKYNKPHIFIPGFVKYNILAFKAVSQPTCGDVTCAK